MKESFEKKNYFHHIVNIHRYSIVSIAITAATVCSVRYDFSLS